MHEKMKAILNPREKILLYCTIGLILCSLCFNSFIVPLLKENSMVNKEIALTRVKLKKYLRLLSQKEKINSRYAQLSLTPAQNMQKEDPALSVLSELERCAKDAGVRIIDIRPLAPTNALANEMAIDVRVEARIEGFLKFTYSVERSALLLEIQSLLLTAKPDSTLLEASLSITMPTA